MRCFRTERLLIFFLAAVIAPICHAAEQRTVTDFVGRTILVPSNPRRIVALAPSITEIIFELKQQHRLVGATRFSDYPPQAAALPKVGSYVKLDLERIMALAPDLCIGIKDGNPLAVVDQLQNLGIPVFAVDPRDLDAVMDSIRAIGDLIDSRAEAARITGDMAERIAKVRACTASKQNKPRVFFQIGVAPIVSVGSDTFIDKLITLAGGVNVAAGPNPYPRFSREQVIAMAPEVMVISSMAREAVFEQVKRQWRQWPAIPAVERKAVFIAPSNLFDRPTPRLVDGLELLAQYIHPEIFEVRQ